jgi:hypothetical protein
MSQRSLFGDRRQGRHGEADCVDYLPSFVWNRDFDSEWSDLFWAKARHLRHASPHVGVCDGSVQKINPILSMRTFRRMSANEMSNKRNILVWLDDFGARPKKRKRSHQARRQSRCRPQRMSVGACGDLRKRDIVTCSELGCETSERPTSKIRSGLLINGQTVAFRLLFRSTQDLRFSANPPQ